MYVQNEWVYHIQFERFLGLLPKTTNGFPIDKWEKDVKFTIYREKAGRLLLKCSKFLIKEIKIKNKKCNYHFTSIQWILKCGNQ